MDDKGTLVVDGFGGVSDDFQRDSLYKERFEYLPDVIMGSESGALNAEISSGDSFKEKVRGLGQFGIFRNVKSDQTDIRITIFIDNDESLKIAEFDL